MKSLEHGAGRRVGKSARGKKSQNEAVAVDIYISTSKLGVKCNRPSLDAGGLLIIGSSSDRLVPLSSNDVAETELCGLEHKSGSLDEEVVTRNPDILSSSKPGLSADVDR
jgi:hypothetical protein